MYRATASFLHRLNLPIQNLLAQPALDAHPPRHRGVLTFHRAFIASHNAKAQVEFAA